MFPTMTQLSHDERVQGLEGITGYTFVDSLVPRAALQVAGHLGGLFLPGGNKRLALLGDKLHHFILAEEGYKTGAARVEIQNVINERASNAHLGQNGRRLGLVDYIYKNPSQGNVVSNDLLATTVEAIIGAVYIDSNGDMDAVRRVITAMNAGWP